MLLALLAFHLFTVLNLASVLPSDLLLSEFYIFSAGIEAYAVVTIKFGGLVDL